MPSKSKVIVLGYNKLKALNSKKMGSVFSNLEYGTSIGSSLIHEESINCPHVFLPDLSVKSCSGIPQLYSIFQNKKKELNVYVPKDKLERYQSHLESLEEFDESMRGIGKSLKGIEDGNIIEVSTHKKIKCIWNETTKKFSFVFTNFIQDLSEENTDKRNRGELPKEEIKKLVKENKYFVHRHSQIFAFVGRCTYDYYRSNKDIMLSRYLFLELSDREGEIGLDWLVENKDKIINPFLCLVPPSGKNSFEETILKCINTFPSNKLNKIYVLDNFQLVKLEDIKSINMYEYKGFLSDFSLLAPNKVKFGQLEFDTIEHFLQFSKTTDTNLSERIQKAPTAKVARDIGEEFKPNATWDLRERAILIRAFVNIFKNNKKLLDKLLLTSNLTINYYKTNSKDNKDVKDDIVSSVLMQLRKKYNFIKG